MTIKKGQQWGSEIVVPSGVTIAGNDAELAGQPFESLSILTAGDLWSTMGQPRPSLEGDLATVVPIDAMEVTIRNSNQSFTTHAASSVTIGDWLPTVFSRKLSRTIVLTNGGLLDSYNVAPRAHPNDGLLDLVTFQDHLSRQQRFLCRRRLVTGTHIPHPHISASRLSSFETERSHAREKLTIDGRLVREWTSISVIVRPDYWRVII